MNLEEASDLSHWWKTTTASDAHNVVPKAVEYGSDSLLFLGGEVARLMGLEDPSDSKKTELAIYVYLVGKVARWSSALSKGQQVSADTLLDITTYSLMARRVQQSGGWPTASAKQEGQD